MSLYQQWIEIAQMERTQEEYDAFWGAYFPAEQRVYQELLKNYENVTTGTVTELAKSFDMETIVFVGFLDGINTSLTESLDLESLTETSEIEISIDFEKLFFNMHDAQANWLYELEEWNAILDLETRKEIKASYDKSKMVIKDKKIGRNDPCPCGSGKKYKKCCLNK